MPTRNSGSGERLIPQVFLKPGGDALAVMNYITTPTATSNVFKKLEEEQEQLEADRKDAGDGKAAANAASAETSKNLLPSAKKSGAGKRKAKAKGKKGDGDAGAQDQMQHASPDAVWSPMAYPMAETNPDSHSGRHKSAVDDFMHLFLGTSTKFEARLNETNNKAQETFRAATMTLFGHSVSCFFEFCWSGSEAINGSYSAFRDELASFISTGCELASASTSSGRTRLSLATHISDVLDGDAGGAPTGHVKDESDEAKATTRIKFGLAKAKQTGMDSCVRDVLALPLEYLAEFCKVTLHELVSLSQLSIVNSQSSHGIQDDIVVMVCGVCGVCVSFFLTCSYVFMMVCGV